MSFYLRRGYCIVVSPGFPANYWDDESSANLYHCAGDGRGFFVELGIDDGRGQAVVLRSFIDSDTLEDYAHGVRLPESLKKSPNLTGHGFFNIY